MNSTSTRLGGIVCAVALLGVSGLLVRTSVSAPGPKCVRGGKEKIKADLTGDPDIDRARWRIAFDAAKEVQRRTVDAAIAKHEAKVKTHGWDGTRLRVKPEITDADRLAAHQAVCEIFLSADPPAPAGRTDQFKAFINPGPKTRVTGYHGDVESVIATENGRIATIALSPSLTGSIAIFATPTSLEEWQIDNDGTLRNLKCQPHPTRKEFLISD